MKIGTDIVYIPKLRKIIDTTPTFINKVYTDKEIEIANTINEPYNFYATRFAAKEAIIKATNSKYDFKEIEILKNEDGSPSPHILVNNNINIELSLSYDNDYAIAFSLIQKK